MSEPAAEPVKANLDAFGLPPPKRGTLRGVIRNIRRSEVEAPFGILYVIDFDLVLADGQTRVPVQMRGTDFSTPLFETWLMDVKDPDPSIRPLVTRRIWSPWGNGLEVISYYPGADDPNTRTDWVWTTVTVVGPLAGAAVAAGLIVWWLDLF